MRIVGIYGIGNYLEGPASEAALSRATVWRSAILRSKHLPFPTTSIEIRVSFYAHRLQPPEDPRSPDLDAYLRDQKVGGSSSHQSQGQYQSTPLDLRTGVDPTSVETLYRLFHQALVDHLLARPWTAPDLEALA